MYPHNDFVKCLLPLLLLCICTCHTKDIPNCNFEDTVDLTDALKLANGSYLYADNVLIPPDQVGIYEYEVIYKGVKVPREPHPRGCLCKERKCIKFCCDPLKEGIFNNTRQCGSLSSDLRIDVAIDVTYPNDTILLTDLRKYFTAVYGIPCENAYAINGLYSWQLFENGSLWIENENQLLSRRDYCISPAEDAFGKFLLSPMDCRMKDGTNTMEILGYMADVISIVFIFITMIILLAKYGFQSAQDICLMCFLISLALHNIILTSGSLSTTDYSHSVCNFMGFTAYFFAVSSFFWMNLMGYDLLQTSKWLMYEGKKHFFMYSAYGWGVPMALTFILMIVQSSNISGYYRPIIGDYICWVNVYNWSAMLYYYGLNIIIFCLDLFIYLMIDYNIKTAWDLQLGRNQLRPFHKTSSQYGLLLLIMGISWIFDTFSYLENVMHPGSDTMWFFIADLADALPGFLIFLCFALKPGMEMIRNGKFPYCLQRSIPYERELNTEFEHSTENIIRA